MLLSTSFAATERFGDRLADFKADLADHLRQVAAPDDLFWERPGDTEVLVARR